MSYKWIDGGVTAAAGFTAGGLHCGVKKNAQKKDLMMVKCSTLCTAAAVYTQNKVYGAPITVTRANLANGHAQAMIANSGNANTCNADGVEKAQLMCSAAAQVLGVSAGDVIVASTGVIGQSLPFEPIASGVKALAPQMSASGADDAAAAIMTTDTIPKQAAVELTLSGKTAHIGAMSKGTGMIAPNMATMLAFITTDACVSAAMLDAALRAAVADSFNMISVDGDTSTNDMACVLASGLAQNAEITDKNADFDAFSEGLKAVCTALAKLMAGDGEGATKRIECNVSNAPTDALARAIAKSVISSNLTKAAMFGADANWGRILCAIGYTPGEFAVDCVDVTISSSAGSLLVCENGAGAKSGSGSSGIDEDYAKAILSQKEIVIGIDMKQGAAGATAWGCDLTYDYVKINGDYRT